MPTMRAAGFLRPRRSLFSARFSSTARGGQAAPIRDAARSRIATVDADRPFSSVLIDNYARRHDYLRISLTERCNLRCFYCMPEEGIELSPKSNILSDDEVIRLATLFVQSGVTKIRLTGGEPTIRKGIIDLVGRLNDLRQYGLKSIGITSNGLVLHRQLPRLIQNGLTHVNISLDTLDPFKFELMTRRMGHDAVLKSLEMAMASPALETKLNAVIVKGLNDCEAVDFVGLTKYKPLSVRFIEFMPFTGNKWDSAKMVPSADLLQQIVAKYPEATKASDSLNDTARSYRIPGHMGSFGFISSMSDHFCGTCNRLRITADGQIKVCLFDAKEVSLRDKIRGGASDAELLQVIGVAVRGKAEKHAFMDDIDVVTNRPMILIGGPSRELYSKLSRPRNDKPTPIHSVLWFRRPGASSTRAPPAKHFSSSSVVSSSSERPQLTHMDSVTGRPAMVNVSSKDPTLRVATARGRILLPPAAFELIAGHCAASSFLHEKAPELEKARAKAHAKGDVLAVAQLAGIMASKRTADLIPLCHPLALSHVSVTLTPYPATEAGGVDEQGAALDSVVCEATVSCEGKTGVEMEALSAVSVALLTVWDMLKAVAGKQMIITGIHVSQKSGGKSGDFERSDVNPI